jgi:ankyrin repeat protein
MDTHTNAECRAAIDRGDLSMLKSVWKHRAETSGMFFRAVCAEQFEIAEWIVSEFPFVVDRIADSWGDTTPLMHCNTDEQVTFLLKHGADVRRKCKKERTALHRFCLGPRNIDILPLLARGADEQAVDMFWKSAIDYARMSNHPQLDVLENFHKRDSIC